MKKHLRLYTIVLTAFMLVGIMASMAAATPAYSVTAGDNVSLNVGVPPKEPYRKQLSVTMVIDNYGKMMYLSLEPVEIFEGDPNLP